MPHSRGEKHQRPLDVVRCASSGGMCAHQATPRCRHRFKGPDSPLKRKRAGVPGASPEHPWGGSPGGVSRPIRKSRELWEACSMAAQPPSPTLHLSPALPHCLSAVGQRRLRSLVRDCLCAHRTPVRAGAHGEHSTDPVPTAHAGGVLAGDGASRTIPRPPRGTLLCGRATPLKGAHAIGLGCCRAEPRGCLHGDESWVARSGGDSTGRLPVPRHGARRGR